MESRSDFLSLFAVILGAKHPCSNPSSLFPFHKEMSPFCFNTMSNSFSYFEGSPEDYLACIKEIKDNRLVKIKLAQVGSFCHVLDNFSVKHIMHRHGGKRELLRGQIPVTYSDLLLIPDIFTNYDSRSSGTCKNENPAIIYTKDLDELTYTLIEEVRTGHSELAASTLYKRKKKLTDAKSPVDSADSGFASYCKGKQ